MGGRTDHFILYFMTILASYCNARIENSDGTKKEGGWYKS